MKAVADPSGSVVGSWKAQQNASIVVLPPVSVTVAA